MNNVDVLLGQSFKHMAGSEEQGKAIVDKYRNQYDIKKSSIQQKTKKGISYWVVSVEVTFVTEKIAYDQYFGE